MDGVVSWHRAMIIARLRFPNADQLTIMNLAKEIYLSNQNINLENALLKKTTRAMKLNYAMQGANI